MTDNNSKYRSSHESIMPNRLEKETSPYLQQHAHNPVDWYPWGEEALSRAKAEDRPIFLSIGYAACHWCHVMAHESFEDLETAQLMNQHFVSIKVDREERPDLDAIYMQATVAMTRQGGWPMSVFLTPDGIPFYAGTYFPITPRYGMPSFRQVLSSLAEAWVNRREDVTRTTDSLSAFYQQESQVLGETAATFDPDLPLEAVHTLDMGFDRFNGGWGQAPKFPQPMTIEFLLAHYTRTGDQNALRMAELNLTKMAYGGIYDQLGGGFHRYSTDAVWLVPHFEKMLYDNSQLARAYVHAWQVTHNPLYKSVALETLDYVAREMTHSDGGFYSTQDADSEGVEGKFFIWSVDEVRTILGDEAVLLTDVYDVTSHGNFEGSNILHLARDPATVATEHHIDEGKLQVILNAARKTLFDVRSNRIKPGRDEKVLTAWNGLMMAAFAEASQVFHREDYRRIAEKNADFILRELRAPEGRLRRSWKHGSGAKLNGYLEDYSHLIEGLLSLYQATFDERWFTAARQLADAMIAHFAAADGTFYDTSDDHEALITRPRDLQDNAVPAGNSVAALVLLKLAAYTGEATYRAHAESGLCSLQESIKKHPTAFGEWLLAYEFLVADIVEIAFVGDPSSSDFQRLRDVVFADYRPNQVVAATRPDTSSQIPLLKGRTATNGRASAYVCHNMACQLPVTDTVALAAQLPALHTARRMDNGA
jgi:uncharacterized protein YyaL (SSP411 family)